MLGGRERATGWVAKEEAVKTPLERVRELLESIKRRGDDCSCDGYVGPCGCGEKSGEDAEEALEILTKHERPTLTDVQIRKLIDEGIQDGRILAKAMKSMGLNAKPEPGEN